MAVHTYIVQPLTILQQNPSDVLWGCTGTADGVPFSISFWQSDVQGFTIAQVKTLVKGLVDAQLFPAVTQPSGVLANFSGGTFTQ